MQLTSGIWTVDITDHLPVFLILPQNQRSKPHKVIINKRQTDESRICSFKNELSVQNWDEILKDGDVNESGLASLVYHTEYDDNDNDDAADDFGDLEGTAPKMTFTEAPVQNYMTIGCTAAKISPVRKKLIQQI